MGIRNLFRRRGPRIPADPADLDHFRQWCRTRVGVEAFLEPETLVSVPGLCLVAFDGEWTRRPVGDVATARKIAGQLKLPLFDASVTGYPQRMRDYEEVRIKRERRERARRLREQMREATSVDHGPFQPRPDRGQPAAAMSSRTARMVRTGTPVPPLGR